jgi:hypothetical protein
VIAYLKENSIDLVKECTYQPWDEATEQRVNNWINIVLSMQDPKSTFTVSDVKANPASEAAPAAAPTSMEEFFSADSDDLPF